jgi:hypothetical protein
MTTFDKALIAAHEGKAIRHPSGLNRPLSLVWVRVGDRTSSDYRLVFLTDVGMLDWIPHQWEILAEDWEIL